MKKKPLNTILKIAGLSLLATQMTYAYDGYQPIIRNNGQYMYVAPSTERMHRLYGHVLADVVHSRKTTPVAANKILHLSIVFELNNESQLDQQIKSITDPKSPEYRHFLSQADFMKHYSPTEAQIKQASNYLTSNGMKIESISPNRLIINASGSVGTIEKIFHTKIYHFTDNLGKSFYAPAYELQVDDALNIISVQGLENRVHAHPYNIKSDNITNSAGPTQGLTPTAIKAAYSLSSTLDGTGQSMALFELDGYTPSDITGYNQQFNLASVPLQNVLVDGYNGSAGSGAGEVTLDIELMNALAPKATKLLVYEGPNSGAGVVDTYNRIATDNVAKNVSTSWGLNEIQSGSTIQAEAPIFKQMVAQGQVLYAASGDSGAYDDGKTLGIDDPSSQPTVVAVGGTTLTTNTNGSYKSEKAWSSGTGPGGSGGGGGISSVWTIPQWQQGVVTPASLGSTTMRNTPDVSFDADPNTGYAIYFQGKWVMYGGTSCAAPLWAAFTALVNQQRVSNGQPVIGFINPTLYTLGQSTNYGATFHDIADKSTNLHYPAVTGYDLATGWGTFVGDPMIATLGGGVAPTCTQNNPSVTITPASQQTTAGQTLSYTVGVTDNDSSKCSASNFSLSALMPAGLTNTLTPTTLNVTPGNTQSAAINVTSQSTLAAGNYSFSVKAINASASTYQGTGSATYSVTTAPNVPGLSITPQNATFQFDSGKLATFNFSLMMASKPIANSLVYVSFTGAYSWNAILWTNASGQAQYTLYLNRYMPVGTYAISASAPYNKSSVVAKTNFYIKR